MILENSIGWCDATANIVTGCDKVSEGCKNCYAQSGTRARVLRALGIETWGSEGIRHPVAEFEAKVRRLNKLCICDKCHRTYPVERLKSFQVHSDGTKQVWSCAECKLLTLRRIRLFADSNSDWLDQKWDTESRVRFLEIMIQCQNIDFLLLTKRPENFAALVKESLARSPAATWECGWVEGDAPENVWIGVSVENQATADKRIPQLLNIPAKIHFISAEPLLEPVDLLSAAFNGSDSFSAMEGINWVIIGGESGPRRRDCGIQAIEDLASQCLKAGVPAYVKQDCAFKPGQQGRLSNYAWSFKHFPSNPL